MGEHRISLKIEFSMHGHTDKMDAWWNFTERDVPGVDYRAIEWLQSQYEKAMDKYLEAQFSADMRRQAEVENREREEFERLKAKFEPPQQS
jgi:hypothetical protein